MKKSRPSAKPCKLICLFVSLCLLSETPMSGHCQGKNTIERIQGKNTIENVR